MKKAYSILLLLCVVVGAMADLPANYTTLKGTVKDAVDNEPLIGVTLYIPELKTTTVTDINGRYQFERLPKKTVTIQVSYVGHQTIIKEADLSLETSIDFTMQESNAMINEVVVTGIAGSQLLKDSPTPVTIVSQRDMQTTTSTNIIDAIARQPGLAQVTTGSGISKPVIRGLGYNRIVTVSDGIRQEGQQWGDEHGIEVDANSVHSIEILKGPASLMYGSDAMAGVVIFHGKPSLPLGQIRGSASTEYQSNNGMMSYSLGIGGNQHGNVWNVRYSEKMAHAYKNKYDSYVLGTQWHERAVSGMAGINRQWGFSHLKLNYYHLTPTMTEGERDETTGEFLKPDFINGEETMTTATRHDMHTYSHGFPYQQVRHYKAVADQSIYIGNGTLQLVMGYQNNRRQEFEEVETPNDCGLDFMLHTIICNANYSWQGGERLKLNAGISGLWQQSINRGEEYLIPDYVHNDIGGYATAGYKMRGWSFSGGLRLDRRHVHAFALGDRFARISRSFDAVTGSVGAVRSIGENSNLRINVARGFRAPNLSELGSNGEHEGTFRYEVGNAQLNPEYSWQADIGWDYTSPIVSAQLSLFANIIDNYIFANRNGNVTEEGTPVYVFTQGDARLLGGEATIDIHPIDRLHFENSFSFVDARQSHQPADRRYLPRTPAPRWVSEISYDLVRDGKVLNNTFVSFGLECYLRQDHIYSADDTETATPSYTLLNFSAGTDILWHRHNVCTLTFTADNLTDRAYQSHLSRLKYAGFNPKTGRQGIYNMGRNFCIKASFPIRVK